jgi:hypothetical protein
LLLQLLSLPLLRALLLLLLPLLLRLLLPLPLLLLLLLLLGSWLKPIRYFSWPGMTTVRLSDN